MLSKPPASHSDVPSTRKGFAVALLSHTKNPIKLARSLYINNDSTVHALLSGESAELLGKKLGEEMVDPSYFFTLSRWREHRKGLGLPDRPYPPGVPEDESETPNKDDASESMPLDQLPKGTVGAVALDERGCIAVATSTGGLTNKLPGRIGMCGRCRDGILRVHGILQSNLSELMFALERRHTSVQCWFLRA